MKLRRILLGLAMLIGARTEASVAQDTALVQTVRTVVVRFIDADLRLVLQTLGQHLDKPLIVTAVPSEPVTLDFPNPVPTSSLLGIIRGLVESRGLELQDKPDYFLVRVPAPASAGVELASQAQGPIQLFVVRLKHARAADVAATVDQLFGGSGVFAGRSGLSQGTLGDELRAQRVPEGRPAATRNDSSVASGSLEGQVTIVPDELTNSLLVRASEADFSVLREAVDRLDIRPLQVLIEVLIVEARSDRSFSLGADIFVPPQAAGGGTVAGTVQGGGLGDLVLRLMNLGKADVDAVIRAAASRGDAEIVSRPVLLASNNTEARFLVGSQRPFVQVSRSLPTDVPTRDQVVQYRDVGTKLTIRPTINADGYVSLLIQQEINAVTGEVQFDAPVIATREVLTQVLVKDGQTIVIGGLRDHQRERVQRGVPILSAIPIIGGLFGSADRHTSRTELYLFLTPRLIRTDEDADRLTAPRLPPEEVPSDP